MWLESPGFMQCCAADLRVGPVAHVPVHFSSCNIHLTVYVLQLNDPAVLTSENTCVIRDQSLLCTLSGLTHRSIDSYHIRSSARRSWLGKRMAPIATPCQP